MRQVIIRTICAILLTTNKTAYSFMDFNFEQDFATPMRILVASWENTMGHAPTIIHPILHTVDNLMKSTLDGIGKENDKTLEAVKSFGSELSSLAKDLLKQVDSLRTGTTSDLSSISKDFLNQMELSLGNLLVTFDNIASGKIDRLADGIITSASALNSVGKAVQDEYKNIKDMCTLAFIFVLCSFVSAAIVKWPQGNVGITFASVPFIIFCAVCPAYGYGILSAVLFSLIAVFLMKQRTRTSMFLLSISVLIFAASNAAGSMRSTSSICATNFILFEARNLFPFCRLHVPGELPQCPYSFDLFANPESFFRNNNKLKLHPQAVVSLSSLPAPLYIHSEIGPINSGKSLRQVMTARILTLGVFDHCTMLFRVREVFSKNASGGITRGIQGMVIPVSVMHQAKNLLPEPLQFAIANLDSDGSLLLLDSEGGNEAGVNSMAAQILQMISLAVSGSVTLALPRSIQREDFKSIGEFAHMLSVLNKQFDARSHCSLRVESSIDAEPTNPVFTSHPRLYVLPKNTDTLIGDLDGVDISPDGKILLHPEATLSVNKKFWDLLNNEKTNNNGSFHGSFKLIVNEFRDATMFANLIPAEQASTVLGKHFCPGELRFYESAYMNSGLPRCWKCGYYCGYGITYGYANFILPAIVQEMRPKVIDSAVANGARLVKFMKELIDLDLLHIRSLIEKADPNQKLNMLCNHIGGLVDDLIMSEGVANFRNELPVEVHNCLEGIDSTTKVACSTSGFNEQLTHLWVPLLNQVCQLRPYFSDDKQFTECYADVLQKKLTAQKNALFLEHIAKCTYTWHTAEYDDKCSGTCPGYKGRVVNCTNHKGIIRPSFCCTLTAEKPSGVISCEQWTYHWKTAEWSPCDAHECGTRHRVVTCHRCDNTLADESLCLATAGKPHTSEQCNQRYRYQYDQCTCHCGQYRSCVESCIACEKQVPIELCHASPMTHLYRPHCGNCPPPPRSSCFSGMSTVLVKDADTGTTRQKMMKDLKIGDLVQSIDSLFQITFSPIYLFGHRDRERSILFATIHTSNHKALDISPGHYLFANPDGCLGASLADAVTLPPEQLKVGYGLWETLSTAESAILMCSTITSMEFNELIGIFNPFTMTGNIIVDGILASVHSVSEIIPVERLLAIGMKPESVAHHAPHVYQSILAPIRLIYSVMGPEYVAKVTNSFDVFGWHNLTFSGLASSMVWNALVENKTSSS